jgi:Flp pilus assembly protein TadG
VPAKPSPVHSVSTFRTLIQRDQGQALVEFALVLPVLLLVLFGLVEFGRGFNYWNDATHISAEGARFAVVNRKPNPNDTASLQEQLRNQADTPELRNGGSNALPTPAQVCVSFPNGTSNIGDPVQVTMTFTYHWLTLLDKVSKLIDNKKGFTAATTFTAKSIMRIEMPPTNYGAGCA